MRSSVEWAAGFFDGEGCVRIKVGKHRKYGSLTIDAGQANPEPLYMLQQLFGGYVGRYVDLRPSRKPAFKWLCSANQAENALQKMLPWLTVKRDEAKLALKYQALVRRGGNPGRKGLSEKLIVARRQIALDLVSMKHRSW